MLTVPLDRLVEEDLLQRVVYLQPPPRYEYQLARTRVVCSGDVVADVAMGLRTWSWPDGVAPPVKLGTRESGADIHPLVVDERTGQRLDVRRTKIRRREP